MATTTGFVQKLQWAGSGIVCVWLGNSAVNAQAFVVNIRQNDTAIDLEFKRCLLVLLVECQVAGRQVGVDTDDSSSEIKDAFTPSRDIVATPLQVEAIEVTQAVQDLAHSVPLLAGKPAVVRVYLSQYGSVPVLLRGQLSLSNPAGTAIVVQSANTVTVDPAQAGNLQAVRDDASKSLNFQVPASMLAAGPVLVRLASLTNATSNAAVAFAGDPRPVVRFQPAAPLRVRIIGMQYTQNLVTYTPTATDFNLLLSWLGRAYPASQVIGSTTTVTADATPPFGCSDINAQLTAIRQQDVNAGTDGRTHYYGIVADGGFFMRGCAAGIPGSAQPDTVASGPTGSGSWGWDTDGSYGDWYGGHELGHTLGRLHPGFCGESQNDLARYPFANGQLANQPLSFAGFDVGDATNGRPMAALPGPQWRDVMTYCSFQWLSVYTYLGIRRRLLDEDALGAGAFGAGTGGGRPDERFPERARKMEGADQPVVLHVVGVLNLTKKRARIRYVTPLENPAEATVAAPGSLAVRATDASGKVVVEASPTVRINSEVGRGDERVGTFDCILHVPPSTRALEILFEGSLADVRAVGGGLGGEALPEGAASANVAAAPAAHFILQVSQNGGRTWETLGVGLAKDPGAPDPKQWPRGTRYRVTETDGLRRAVIREGAL